VGDLFTQSGQDIEGRCLISLFMILLSKFLEGDVASQRFLFIFLFLFPLSKYNKRQGLYREILPTIDLNRR
jgi:hypothetical protein